jgi:hypothetical protein
MLVMVAIAAVGAFLFFIPVVPVLMPPPVMNCSGWGCTWIAVHGYGSVSYVRFGFGGTFYSPDHFRILNFFA